MAIEMWFMEKDEVSTHTLAAAAYQIVHDLNEDAGTAQELLFTAKFIEEGKRAEFIKRLRTPQNFFKHADNDPDPNGKLTLDTYLTYIFLVFSCVGLALLKADLSTSTLALTLWAAIYQPELLKEGIPERLLPPELLQALREQHANHSRPEFFSRYKAASELRKRMGI